MKKKAKKFSGFLRGAPTVEKAQGIGFRLPTAFVKRWINCGTIDADCETCKDIESSAQERIAETGTYEILGRPIFQAIDGQYYTVTLVPIIAPAEPKDVKEALRKEN